MQQKIQYFLFLQDDERGSNTLIDADEKIPKFFHGDFFEAIPHIIGYWSEGCPGKK